MGSERPIKVSRKVTVAVEASEGDEETGQFTTESGDEGGASTQSRQTLTVLVGPDEGRVLPLEGDEIWLGRGDDCDILIADRDVSRRHASIRRKGAHLFVRDNATTNGTFVNNRRVVEQELETYDEIRLGPTVTLVFTDTRTEKRARFNARALREKYLADQSQSEKEDAIASVVAGVAHEINTPLGVAGTATALIEALAEEVRRDPSGERVAELLADLTASTDLMTKNLERANQLVNVFKQLSSDDRDDEHGACDLRSLIERCLEELRVDLTLREITVRTTLRPEGADFPWLGYERSLSEVLLHLLRNVLRHAYDGEGGRVDVVLAREGASSYRLEIEDYGAGLTDQVQARMFEPFTAAQRDKGMGFGLAIVRNIVTNGLGGTISCTSERGKGTRFVIVLPRESPVARASG